MQWCKKKCSTFPKIKLVSSYDESLYCQIPSVAAPSEPSVEASGLRMLQSAHGTFLRGRYSDRSNVDLAPTIGDCVQWYIVPRREGKVSNVRSRVLLAGLFVLHSFSPLDQPRDCVKWRDATHILSSSFHMYEQKSSLAGSTMYNCWILN